MALTVATVETAIEALMSGAQSYSVDGLSYTSANLSALIDLRNKLQTEADRSAGTRPTFRAFKMSGMGD